MKVTTDIDIDLADRTQLLKHINFIPAAIIKEGQEPRVHNTGVYLQDIPRDPLSRAASIDYKEAEERGWFKIDLLNLGIYQDIESEAHLDRLVEQEPIWELFQSSIVRQLNHVNNHGDLLRAYPPKSLEDLAIIIAMVRPGKAHLIGQPWETVKEQIWLPGKTGEYVFRRSHSLSYALSIIVQLNRIVEKLEASMG